MGRVSGGLDGQPCGHGRKSLEMPMPAGTAGHLAKDGEQVQQAEDDPDGCRAVSNRGGYAEAEQRDQGEVEH
jgi:hypothetical protein